MGNGVATEDWVKEKLGKMSGDMGEMEKFRASQETTNDYTEKRLCALELRVNWILTTTILTLVAVTAGIVFK